MKRAKEKAISLDEPEFFNALPGLGVEVELRGMRVLVGNRKLMETNSVGTGLVESKMKALES